jgi:glucosamine--fructose-6-phosphate aminotransferase (isomerizing)
MCGIFGVVSPQGRDLERQLDLLFVLSESRGKEAAGLALQDGADIKVIKEAQSASRMLQRKRYRALMRRTREDRRQRPITAIGHSRLVTNGLDAVAANNQPVVREGLVGIHNGIIVNDAELWDRFDLKRTAEVDTEVFLALVEKFRRGGSSLAQAVAQVFTEVEGTASVAILSADDDRLVIGTNNGSLYFCRGTDDEPLYFASERHILSQFLKKMHPRLNGGADAMVESMPAGRILLIDTRNRAIEEFNYLSRANATPADDGHKRGTPNALRIVNLVDADDPRRAKLRRCTCCIMPETMPFIEFDEKGVCNYCRTYVRHRPLGLDALREKVAAHRRDGAGPDCVVAVSGGRDSCYGLHVIKTQLGLNPVAYTYDWGLITDLARRNQARLCGKLGVEHILVSADIRRKRDYVKRNVEAWLKRPSLGMVPLFMAGDKLYFYYSEETRRQLGVELSFLCENKLELAHFKSGFMGINEGHSRVYNVGLHQKMALLFFYGREYVLNPSYLNRSLIDTIVAFYSSYFLKHPQLQLYDYAAWEEDELVSVLRSEYDWELSPDTTSTWRIGDGTAAFYNYIYYTVAGFTENDALRSNQIRQGVMDRDTALRLVEKENEPRWESMRWYANTIGFSLNDALQVINGMPRLYADA